MNRNRPLFEHETYARANDSSINIVPNKVYRLPSDLKQNRTVSLSSLSLTLVGEDLLTNLHQFGKGKGRLRFCLNKVDQFGVQWDPLSMHRVVIRPSEFILDQNHMSVSRTVQSGLRPSSFERKVGFDPLDMNALTQPVVWQGPDVFLEGAKLTAAAWKVNETTDHTLNRLDSWRLDLLVDNQKLSLTHLDVPPAAPLPLPREVALPFLPNEPLGYPLAGVLKQRVRKIGQVDQFGQVVPKDGLMCKPLVIFDPADRRLINHQHPEDLWKRVPVFEQLVLYAEFPRSTPDSGRTRLGEFESLHQLIEYCGGYEASSRQGAYQGKDIVYLEMPLYVELNGELQEQLHVEWVEGVGVDRLEVRSRNGSVRFDKHRPS